MSTPAMHHSRLVRLTEAQVTALLLVRREVRVSEARAIEALGLRAWRPKIRRLQNAGLVSWHPRALHNRGAFKLTRNGRSEALCHVLRRHLLEVSARLRTGRGRR